MNKSLVIVLLVVGIMLVGYGVYPSLSAGDNFSSLVTDFRSNKSLWLVLAGGVAIVVGCAGWIRSKCSR